MSALILALIFALQGHAIAIAPVSPPNPAENCISDICGPPPQSNLYMTKYVDRITDYMKSIGDKEKTDFPPATSKLFDELIAEKEKQYTDALALFKKSIEMGEAQPAGISKALYNISYATPFLSKIKYNTATVNGKTYAAVDVAASTAALKDLSPDDRHWILQTASDFAAVSNEGVLSDDDIQSEPPRILLKALHPDASMKESMRLELQQAQSAVASLKNVSPLEKALFFSQTSPDRISLIADHAAQGTIDENEIREIIQWNRSYKFSNHLFRDPKSPLLTRPTPSVEKILQQAGGMNAIVESFTRDQLKDRRDDEGKIQSCRMQYFINKGLLPNQDQVNTLKKDISRSKKLVKDLIKSKFPPSMRQKLIQAVENTDFIMPPTAAEFEKSFTDSLRQKVKAQKASGFSGSDISPQDMRQLVPALSLTMSSRDPNEKDDSNEYCDAFKYSPMSDANYTAYGSIMLSFTTATGDEVSRMKTIMHELGHSVSKAITDDRGFSARFASVRKCLADQHTEELPPQTKKDFEAAKALDPELARTLHAGTAGPYVEEDFADTVAGESSKELPGRNAWCQFMTLTYDRQQYQESGLQADDEDTHSSSIFRLLHFEVMKKGHLPDSCRGYLASVKFTDHFDSCLDLADVHDASAGSAGTVK